jgi:RNA polymerase sigma-70 factor, ECF subfamily
MGLEQPDSDMSRQFDRQHDRFVLHGMLQRVVQQFEPATINAFRMHVLEGVDAKVTAERLGVSPRVVYIAKSRVLRALRELAADWIDELSLA